MKTSAVAGVFVFMVKVIFDVWGEFAAELAARIFISGLKEDNYAES
jgi:hypothetical protein